MVCESFLIFIDSIDSIMIGIFLLGRKTTFFIWCFSAGSHRHDWVDIAELYKQAGAELGQAQLQLELGFTLRLLYYIDEYQLPLHITECKEPVNLVTKFA